MKNSFRIVLQVTAACILSFFVACEGNDGPAGNEPPVVDSRVDSLKTVLNRQMEIMSAVLTGDMSVSMCTLQSNGTYKVNFVDGSGFVAFAHDGSYKQILSCAEEAGVVCWALLDAAGDAFLLKDASQKGISLDVVPEAAFVDDVLVLNVGGQTFTTSFGIDDVMQVFGFEVHKDVTGAVYAVTLRFADGIARTFGVVGYPAASFLVPETDNVVKDYYIDYGMTASVVLDIEDGVEFTTNVSSGWTVNKRVVDGKIYMDITAPGEGASSNGKLDVLIGGDIVVASLELSAEPFRDMFASSVNAVVNTYSGVSGFAYGVCVSSAYDEETMQATASQLLSGSLASGDGCGTSVADVCVQLASVVGSELAEDTDYTLWAAPAVHSGNSVAAGKIRAVTFRKIVSSIEIIGEPGFIDADIKVNVKEADALFGGISLKNDDLKDEILYQVNNSIYDSLIVAGKTYGYEGKASEFKVSKDQAAVNIMPGETYMLWVAPAVTGNYEYIEADILFKEFTAAQVTSGGELQVSLGAAELTPSSAVVPISSEGASMIYYTCLHKTSEGGLSLTAKTDEEKFAAIVSSKRSMALKASSATAKFTGLEPENEYYVYAVAVDASGKYGPVSHVKIAAPKLVYNDITLKVSEEDVKATSVTVKVTSSGDLSDYIYWFGSYNDSFWKNDCKLTESAAGKYMALNPDDERIARAMRKYGEIASDGTISFSELAIESQYVFVILEKDEQNKYSKAKHLMIRTLSADLGVIVREGSDQWNKARDAVKIEWHAEEFEQGSSNMLSRYAFDFSCPANLTAYVLCGSETYFNFDEYSKIENVMIEIEDYTSRSYDDGTTPTLANGAHAQEPAYYKDGERKEGQLMNVYLFYVHGIPTMGCLTYFAPDTHGENNCDSWEKGVCSNYQSALDKIARYNTLEPYKEKASQFGLKGNEYDQWVQDLFDAYQVYYKDAKPLIYVNDGSSVRIVQPSANGLNDKGEVADRVIVMFKDLQGNYYEPMYYEVPNYFE